MPIVHPEEEVLAGDQVIHHICSTHKHHHNYLIMLGNDESLWTCYDRVRERERERWRERGRERERGDDVYTLEPATNQFHAEQYFSLATS